MKKTTKNILLKVGFLLFAGLFMLLAISGKIMRDNQAVSDLRIHIDHTSGNFFITDQDVTTYLKEFIPDSGSVMQIEDLRKLEIKLEEIPQVKASNVYVNNLGQLSIDIKQRQPIYRVIRKNMKSYYVDENGYKFPVSRKYTSNVPVVTGFIADNGSDSGPIQNELSKEVRKVMEYLLADKFLKAQFGQLVMTKDGEFELIPRVGNHTVQLGSSVDIDNKMKRLKVFYKEGLTKTGWNTYKTINIKYKDQVVCSK